jgi:hypothetical protein
MSVALPAGGDGDGASAQSKLDAALQLLNKVIELLDSAGAPPELAARAQETHDAIADYQATK